MAFNVPRLGAQAGFVHPETGSFECGTADEIELAGQQRIREYFQSPNAEFFDKERYPECHKPSIN